MADRFYTAPEVLRRAKLTQIELADLLGTYQSTISKVATGKMPASASLSLRICKAFNLQPVESGCETMFREL
jgi:transcriptional regulator with XRE-family HTH domain